MSTFSGSPKTQLRGECQGASHDTLYSKSEQLRKLEILAKAIRTFPGEEAANASRATHAKPKQVGEACQFKSRFSSAATQKTMLTKKGISRKKPQPDGV